MDSNRLNVFEMVDQDRITDPDLSAAAAEGTLSGAPTTLMACYLTDGGCQVVVVSDGTTRVSQHRTPGVVHESVTLHCHRIGIACDGQAEWGRICTGAGGNDEPGFEAAVDEAITDYLAYLGGGDPGNWIDCQW